MSGFASDSAIQAFRSGIRGEVIRPGEEGYDEARTLWNARLERRPAAIVRCVVPEDVAASVRFARQHDIPLSVRSGGHDFAGNSVCDGGLVVDLSPMDSVEIDAGSRRARVGPGARWGAFDEQAQAHGLATTGGTVSAVGVAGYFLGGGTGYLARKHGLALDNLLAAEVVLTSGERVRASGTENPDLFWALRGGGGNFGIVTSFEVQLHELGPEIQAGQVVHPFDRAGAVLRHYRDFMASAPDEVTCYAFIMNIPPLPAFALEHHGKPAITLVMAHAGAVEEGEATLGPLLDFGDPILKAVQPMPYVAAQQMFDDAMPNGQRWYSRAQYFETIGDDAIDTALRYGGALQGPFSSAYFEPMGGAINRVDPEATAFPHRHAAASFHIVAGWIDPAESDEVMAWTRQFHDAMSAHTSGGVYVNLMSEDEQDRVEEAYGDNLERLARIKRKYDPDNVLRSNQNIIPAN
jgi:FAD/FMN-containing dehydrogenase